MPATNPYTRQGARAFWRRAVTDVHYAELAELWQPIDLKRSDRVATAGSCFAQHLGNNLAARGANFLNLEPAPIAFESENEARRFGYGVFSCRYGNIYTSRQLIQLFEEAHEVRHPSEIVWKKDGRFFDALRPGVDPVGQDSEEIVLALRKKHLEKVRQMFATIDLLVFTMGLTEGWQALGDETMYPTAPGTIAGEYDPSFYGFKNLRYAEILDDMVRFRHALKRVNSNARILLTVSPVPLVATATDKHVLVATVYSKSILRGVAGELSDSFEDITYFPSYEIISSHPMRGTFFNPDLRTVNACGVEYVMKHFFSGTLADTFRHSGSAPDSEAPDIMCDEETLAKLELQGYGS